MTEESKYLQLRAINVNEHIEKKNNLSYLSWAWAVDILLQQDSSATWEYAEPKLFGNTMMVFCTVHAFGKSMTAQLPVMDYRNKAIEGPDAFSVNTAMQRCLAKAIALHGLGLYIYAGEDLPENVTTPEPEDENKVKPPNESAKSVPRAVWDELPIEEQNFLTNIGIEITAALIGNKMDEAIKLFYNNNLDVDEQTALWSRLDSKQRRSMNDYRKSLNNKAVINE